MAIDDGKGSGFRIVALAAGMALGLVLAPVMPGMADTGTAVLVADEDPMAEPKRQLEEATRALLNMLELMIGTIPQYEPPEILDNGDIIIRRIRPEKKPAPPPTEDDGDAAQT